MTHRRFFILFALTLSVLMGGLSIHHSTVRAEVTEGLAAVGKTVKLPSTDPRILAARIINVALGVIGIVLLVLILYAGFLYMTSGGEKDKIDTAKKIITNAIIGLIIILSAWAITRFVISKLLEATTGGDGGVTSVGGGPGGALGGAGGAAPFKLVSIAPMGKVSIRNIQVKIVFNKFVDEKSLSAVAVLKDGGSAIGGSFRVAGPVVFFVPAAACPAPYTDKNCFDGNTDVIVKVSSSLRSVSGQSLICSGFGISCEGKFRTGTLVDTEAPKVKITYPTDGQSIKANSPTMLVAEAMDDSGVATVEFFDNTYSIAVDAPSVSISPRTFSATAEWSPTSASLGKRTLGAIAADIDTNLSSKNTVSVVVRPEHCFNKVKDSIETGIDCGGDPASPEFCGACSGSVCVIGEGCASGVCLAGRCVDQPIISSVAPLNGKKGTYVTISGTNFGSTPGTVTFLGGPGPKDDAVASPPLACVEAGATTWTSTQAIVAVPDVAVSGPIQIKNTSNGLYDATNDSYGPSIPSFLVDGVERPGLCALKPASGTPGSSIESIGERLGSTTGKILFGDAGLDPLSWSPSIARWKVPVVSAGDRLVRLKTGTGESNPVTFSVLDKSLSSPPFLSSIDPPKAPPQQYVTLFGKNFGYSLGKVIFTDASGRQAIGDISFPAGCGIGFWRDERIVIKVPRVYTSGVPTENGTYKVKIQRTDGSLSNDVEFSLNVSLKLLPGICTIEPALGPVNTLFKLHGDQFGFDKPTVTFYLSKLAPIDSNTDQRVTGRVPSGALTGHVFLTAAGVASNKVPFEVRDCNESSDACAPSEQCCLTGECRLKTDVCGTKSLRSEYAWETSTGLIPIAPRVLEECIAPSAKKSSPPMPSPTPWIGRAGGAEAPVDALVAMRFSRLLEATTVNKTAFRISRCTSASSEPCATKEDVKISSVEYGLAADDQSYVKIEHPPFAIGTTYLVAVSSSIKAQGPDGSSMDVDTKCGKGPGGETYGYCFRFKTRATTDADTVGAVVISPSLYTMRGAGETAAYTALPLSARDACIVLDCKPFDWKWYTGTKSKPDSDGRASVLLTKVAGKGACNQTVRGNADTGAVPVDINAEVAPSGPAGFGQLFITFVPPRIEAYAPQCTEACSNGLLWAQFTGELTETSVKTPGNVEIRKCANENCIESELLPPLPIPTENIDLLTPFKSSGDTRRLITANPIKKDKTSILEPGGFYRVLLKGGLGVINGIKGKNGMPIAGLNHPQGFQWKFRVKQGADASCKAERIEMIPREKIETRDSARQLFVAIPFGAPDACSADGQALAPSSSFTWKSSAVDVADFYRIKGSLIDTGGKLPFGCSGACLAIGAVGVQGKVAVCGNKIIETTDANFCNVKNDPTKTALKTPAGRACIVMSAGSQAGEECEPELDGDICDSTTCLFRPVKPISLGTCGNGVVDAEKGEACDFGLRCVGGSAAITAPPVSEYATCAGEPDRIACEKARGKCGIVTYRGCSAACRNTGGATGSVCGNSAIGDGEDCDDGNTTNGDGCNSLCLHEGSVSTETLPSVCGNSVLEPGETCEVTKLGSSFPVGCDAKLCLHLGAAPCASPTDPLCCGNGIIGVGEDCDDGNVTSGDGCSSRCGFEGSSVVYAQPSFCGNGIIETGEQCEAGASSEVIAKKIGYGSPSLSPPLVSRALGAGSGKGDGLIDAAQFGLIIGKATPDVSGRMLSTLSAELEGRIGTATYGLQCGFTDESSCPSDLFGNAYGLDDNGCCTLRPLVKNKYPLGDNICRNVLLQAEFNVPMSIPSVINNFEITQKVEKGDCPAGTKAVLVEKPDTPGIFGRLLRVWNRILGIVTGKPAYALKWCRGGVTGQLVPVGSATSATKFTFSLDRALAPKTTYHVRFLGDSSTPIDPLADNGDPLKREGIKTARGVVRAAQPISDVSGDLVWEFTTGDTVCAVNVISVIDTTKKPDLPDIAHPYLFINKDNQPEKREFTAYAQSLQDGVAITLSKVAEYKWDWAPWTTSDGSVVITAAPGPATFPDVGVFQSRQKNGRAVLTATVKISKDTISPSPTVGTAVKGIAPVSVLVCENPWPSLESSPFRDAVDSPQFRPGDPFYASSAYFNFSIAYCRDTGKSHDTTDDLPALLINQIPPTPLDTSSGILRQYLFSYPAEEALGPYAGQGLQQDGIGIRIVSNPQHLSPEEWYASRGFTGSPTSLSVDGYPAIQDGTTIYVAAANRPQGSKGKIYSNVYLISHNPDAKPVTIDIFKQMVKTLTFNINKEFVEQSNVCVQPTKGSEFIVYKNPSISGGEPISCSTDWDCLTFGENSLHCDSLKLKLTRDTKRMADFQTIAKALEVAKRSKGAYPQAVSGTYLRNFSTSLWSSWQEELGTFIGGRLPIDPVNRFLTCGRCETSGQPCRVDVECPKKDDKTQACRGGSYQAGVWKPNDAINPQSCWNQKDHIFLCPKLPTVGGDYGVSRVYQYRSLVGGERYDLGVEFEVPPPATDASEWWSPPLSADAFRCVTASTFGRNCASVTGSGGDDSLCGTPIVSGACRQIGGTFRYKGICQGTPFGEKGVCGDGIVNEGEICDVGMTRPSACVVPASSAKGHRQQICDLKTCKGYVDDPAHPLCLPDIFCGNGRIDKVCSFAPDASCFSDADCLPTGGACVAAEACDDGTLNGTYGRCNTKCDGYAWYCGDSVLSGGESCDRGSENGDYCGVKTDPSLCCALDCRGTGPYCGDKIVNGPEQCDGQTESAQSAVCSSGPSVGKLCEKDSDCEDRVCVYNAIEKKHWEDFHKALGLKLVELPVSKICSTTEECRQFIYKTTGEKEGSSIAGSCPLTAKGGLCGNVDRSKGGLHGSCVGHLIGGYETQHTRSCISPSEPKACTRGVWSGCEPKGRCGDGIKDPIEECDTGPSTGDTKACTSTCKKNICGDGKVFVGVEECDNGADNGKVTCSAEYGSMCLSCSTTCKFMATAGGYCGDAIKNGPEHCDAKDGLLSKEGVPITCQALGYDYGSVPITSVAPDVIKAFETKKPGVCRYYRETSAVGEAQKALEKFISSERPCATHEECDESGAVSKVTSEKGELKVDLWSASKASCVLDVPSCTSGCTFGGCSRCSDPVDPTLQTSISGRVREGIYINQPVPKARVTLLYKGVKIAETFTDDLGKFTFKELNITSSCNAYRVVVDFYGDNPKTIAVDESINGGYWPYTSLPFAPLEFAQKGIENVDGIIFLLPRVRTFETLVTVNWLGSLTKTAGTTAFIDAHLLLPLGYAFKKTTIGTDVCYPDTLYTYATCGDPKPGSSCEREIQWNTPGHGNLEKPPHGRMYCYKVDDPSCESCTVFDTSPEVMKYSTLYAFSEGSFDFYLVDYYSKWQTSEKNYFTPLQLSITVVTGDTIRTLKPKPGTFGHVWHVYSQDAELREVKFIDTWITKAEATKRGLSALGS